MMNQDHVLTSEAAFMAYVDLTSKPLSFIIPGVAGIWLGCQMPDIDNKNSHIHHLVPLSFLASALGHRGFVHSVWAWGLFSWLMIFLNNWLSNILVKPLDESAITSATGIPMLHAFFICMIVGFGLHLFEDSFSKAGEIWFFPFPFKHYKHIRYTPKNRKHKHSLFHPHSQTVYMRTDINTKAWFRYTSISWGPKAKKELRIRKCASVLLFLEVILYLAILLGLINNPI